MGWRTAARLLELDLPSRRDELAFQLASPVGADAVAAARALVDEHGARAADAVHRALEEFAPGGLVRDVGDLPACIELRALADEHLGPWVVFQYATMAAMRPIIRHVQERMLARNQPLGVRNVVHIKKKGMSWWRPPEAAAEGRRRRPKACRLRRRVSAPGEVLQPGTAEALAPAATTTVTTTTPMLMTSPGWNTTSATTPP